MRRAARWGLVVLVLTATHLAAGAATAWWFRPHHCGDPDADLPGTLEPAGV